MFKLAHTHLSFLYTPYLTIAAAAVAAAFHPFMLKNKNIGLRAELMWTCETKQDVSCPQASQTKREKINPARN